MTMPVSGPGPFSQRTDRQPIRTPTGLPYGEAGQLTAAQQAAPLPQSSNLPTPVPIHAPTANPGEPITAGVDRGPGPGSEVLTQRPAQAVGSPLVQALSTAAAGDSSGMLASLLAEAMKRGL